MSFKNEQSLKDRITNLEFQVKDLKKQLEEFKEFVTNILRQPCNDTYPLLSDNVNYYVGDIIERLDKVHKENQQKKEEINTPKNKRKKSNKSNDKNPGGWY